MSNYTITTPFAGKDALPDESHDKIIRGSEFATEFNNIETAVNSKADITAVTAVADSVTALDNAKLDKSGGSLTGSLLFAGSEGIAMGNDNDLLMYHSGDHSFLEDVGTGNLYIRSNGAGVAINTSTNAQMGEFNNGGSVNLYYNASKKFNTTETGVNVTGLSIGGTEITASAAEINYLEGVTSNIQEQIDNIDTGVGSGDYVSSTDPDYIKLTQVNTTAVELNYVDGVTSNIQSQLNALLGRIQFLEEEVLGGGL